MIGESPRAIVATDLDGTLLRSDGTVSPAVLSALKSAGDRGVAVVFVSGRPWPFMRPIVEHTDHRGLAICANGAMTLHPATDTVLRQASFDAPHAEQLVTRAAAVPEAIQTRVMLQRGSTTHGSRRLIGHGSLLSSELQECLSEEWQAVKFAVVGQRHLSAGAFLDVVTRQTAGLGNASRSTDRSPLAEIAPIGVDKASALAHLVEQWGLSAADVHAVGDMPNDLPMLQWAGNSYAVANAHEDVLSIAGEVLPRNDDDGVAELLRRLE